MISLNDFLRPARPPSAAAARLRTRPAGGARGAGAGPQGAWGAAGEGGGLRDARRCRSGEVCVCVPAVGEVSGVDADLVEAVRHHERHLPPGKTCQLINSNQLPLKHGK